MLRIMKLIILTVAGIWLIPINNLFAINTNKEGIGEIDTNKIVSIKNNKYHLTLDNGVNWYLVNSELRKTFYQKRTASVS